MPTNETESHEVTMIDITPSVLGQVRTWSAILQMGSSSVVTQTENEIARILAQLMRVQPEDKYPTGEEVVANWKRELFKERYKIPGVTRPE